METKTERRYGVSLTLSDANEVIMETKATVPEYTAKSLMSQFGFYVDEPKPATAMIARPPSKVACVFKEKCADYYEKCDACANNEAKNYFKPKEAS